MLYIIAEDVTPLIVSIIFQFFLPIQKPLIARPNMLLSINTSPSFRNTLKYFPDLAHKLQPVSF